MTGKLNLIETIAQQEKFSTFTRLMATSGMNELISSGQFTVFVPTNDAFSKVPEAKINDLVNEPDHTKLKELLSYHIMPGKTMVASLVSSPGRKALTGEELMFTDINGLKVNGASIQARNLEASNGVVHALDTLLTPTRVPRLALSETRPTTLAAVPSKVSTKSAPVSGMPITAAAPSRSQIGNATPAGTTAATARAAGKSIL